MVALLSSRSQRKYSNLHFSRKVHYDICMEPYLDTIRRAKGTHAPVGKFHRHISLSLMNSSYSHIVEDTDLH